MTDHVIRIGNALEAAGIEVNEVRPLPTGLGRQLRCAGGRVVVVYDSGAVVAQGKDAAAVKAILAKVPAKPKPAKVGRVESLAPATPTAAVPVAPDPVQPRLPPGWTTEPWDGVSPPW